VLANVLTLAGVAYIFHADNANIVAKAMNSDDRVITPRVVMAIVGATTIQLGALAITMGKYLYPIVPQPLVSPSLVPQSSVPQKPDGNAM